MYPVSGRKAEFTERDRSTDFVNGGRKNLITPYKVALKYERENGRGSVETRKERGYGVTG